MAPRLTAYRARFRANGPNVEDIVSVINSKFFIGPGRLDGARRIIKLDDGPLGTLIRIDR